MEKENKYRYLAKDTIIFGIGNFGSKILSFLCVSLYTAYLSTAEYGIADLLTTTINLLMPVLTASIAEATLRFFYDKNENHSKVLSINIAVIILASIVILPFSLIAKELIPTVYEYWWFFYATFILVAIDTCFSYVVKGNGKTIIFAIKGIAYTASFIIFNILFLVVFKMHIVGYFWAHLIAYFVSGVVMYFGGSIYKYKISFHIDLNLLKRMLIYSIPMVPATIAWWINSSADKYMVVWMFGTASNGVYSVAQKIPTIITAITSIFTSAWQISAMKNYESEDFNQFFNEIFRLISTLLIVGLGFIVIFNKILALFLFRNDFFAAWMYVPMLSLAACFSTLAGFLASAFTTAKKTNILFISTVVAAIVNIILNFVLMNIFGTFGAAIATVISFVTMAMIRRGTMREIVKLQISYKFYISFFVYFCVATITYFFSQYYLYYAIPAVLVVYLINVKDIFILTKSTIKKLKN